MRGDRGTFWRWAVGAAVLVAGTPAFGQGYICAEGGGSLTGGNWADDVLGWMVERGGFGDVIILGVSGTDTAAASVFRRLGAASASNLAIGQHNADSSAVYDAITAADIVWIRGGDQSAYVQWWSGTLTEQAILDVYAQGGVVGGTSAGLHILSELVYDARVGSTDPRQALRDGLDPTITFTTDFLGLVPGVLLDSHFTERGRLGRLAVFLARAVELTGFDPLAIGVDDRTALCVGPGLTAEIRGEGAVTFLSRTPATRQALDAGRPPAVTALRHDQLTAGYVYDLTGREVIARPPGAALVGPPDHTPTFSDAELRGSSADDQRLGEVRWLDAGDDSALFNGTLRVVPGDDVLHGVVLSTRTWDSFSFDENRVGGPQLAIHQHPHRLAVLMDGGTSARARAPACLDVLAPLGAESSLVLLDAWGMISTARGPADRQAVAIEGAMLHVLPSGWRYDAATHTSSGPGACPADLTGDGRADTNDFFAYLALHQSGDPRADLTGDGAVDSNDFFAFLAAYQAGCG